MPGDEFDANEAGEEITTQDVPEAGTDLDVDAAAEEAEASILGEDANEEQEVDPEVEQPPMAPPGPAAPLQQMFPMDQFAQVMRDTISPLLPKPIVEKHWSEDPKQIHAKMLANPEAFHKGFNEAVDHKVSQALKPIMEKLHAQGQLISHTYARSAEREGFSDLSQKAEQMSQAYGIPYQTALRMASDQASKAKPPTPSRPKVKTPGKHAAAPTSSRDPKGDRQVDDSKGSTDFRDIMKEVRRDAQGKFTGKRGK